MAVTIQTRRDDSTDWTTANPVLALGEIGIETDTDKAKYGDGFTAWNDLPYWISGTSDLEQALDDHIADTTIHYAQSAIDHTVMQNIGTNDHAAIDAHIADGGVHAAPGTADGNTLRWEADQSAWVESNALVVDDAGNVGIGTNAPDGNLHVAGNGNTGTPSILVGTTNTGLTGPSFGYFGWWKEDGSSPAGPILLASIELENSFNNGSIGSMVFKGTTSGNANVEHMRIAPSGKVLIGTTTEIGNANAKVQINNNGNGLVCRRTDGATTSTVQEWWGAAGGNTRVSYVNGQGDYINAVAAVSYTKTLQAIDDYLQAMDAYMAAVDAQISALGVTPPPLRPQWGGLVS